jgi:uncharacterized membrane protein
MTSQPAHLSAVAESTSRFRLSAKTFTLIFLLAATAISAYLSYVKAVDAPMACIDDSAFNCGVVQNSSYSEILGIPIAWLGLATNLILLGMLALEGRVAFLSQFGATLIFGIVFFGFLYSVYLVYLQHFVIKAYCPWCLTHEALYTALLVTTGLTWWRNFRQSAA